MFKKYRVYEENPRPRHQFKIISRNVPLWLRIFRNKTFDTWLFDESADVFFDELVYWDGYRSAKNSIQYVTCNKQNADIVQAFAHITGRAAQLKVKDRREEHPKWSVAYVLDIWLTPKNCHEVRNKPKKFQFDGTVYCAETSTGFFLVRRNGRVWVTGNSGRLIQLQNLPQNHIPDLAQARALVRGGNYEALSMLYEDIPDTLSQLIRTAFVPQDGRKFIVADFSAIEARVIAWFAGERWRLKVFEDGGDIYCATASQMFKCKVEKHGENAELRQKGKIAVLALGYGGGVAALENMGGSRMGLSQQEEKDIMTRWRSANPRIVKFWTIIETAAVRAIKYGEEVTINRGIVVSYRWGMLLITLPSGRTICYPRATIGMETGDGWRGDHEIIEYEGLNQTTKKWEKIRTYGGKLTENVVQAIARDILGYIILRADKAGLNIVFHIHDEIVVEAEPGQTLQDVEAIFCKPIDWCRDLPLKGAGYTTPYYLKD